MTTFTWSAADFGFNAQVDYVLQMDATGDEFAEPITLAQTNNLSAAFTVGGMNNFMLSNYFPWDVAADLEFRLMATIHEDVDTMYSSVMTLSITPFEKVVIYPRLFVPGEHNGWNAGDSTSSVFSIKSNDKYEGYIWTTVSPSGFKLTRVPAWEEANTIGDPDAAGTSGTLQDGSWGGNNIMIQQAAGYIKINADLTALTYTLLRTEWGVIGSATAAGWDSDQDMTYDPSTGVWSATLDLVAGEIKFRANDAWDLNYGSDNANGILGSGQANIPIAAAGNYTIVLDLRGPLYRYTVTAN
jgi:hypothetical protein